MSTLAQWQSSLLSAGGKAAAAGLAATQRASAKIHVPDGLTALASETKQFTLEPSARTYQFCRDSPGTIAACIAVGAGLAVVAAPGVVAAPALLATGFGGNGVLAGSMAAGFHSAIGNVAASSVFAICQSAGAGGYGVAAVHGAFQLAGGLTAASGVIALSKTEATSSDGEDESDPQSNPL